MSDKLSEKWAYIRDFHVDDIQHENSECKHAIDELYDGVFALEQQVDWLGGEYKWLWAKLRSLQKPTKEADDDLDKLTTQQKPTEEAMEEI